MIVACLDTNVIVSSLLNPSGTPGQIMKHWEAGDFEIPLSRLLFEEVADVLRRPAIRRIARVTPRQIDEFLELVPKVAVFVPEPLQIVSVVKQDPDDDVVLATALAARANVIVSGDQHLLEIGSHEEIPIVTPAEFLRMLS
jgi:putative PIN family toxin of toxin-antitoxin system